MDSTAPAFRPGPARGRVYTARRIVRSTDVTPSGRLRLDALARYLQTVAEDDLADSGELDQSVVWLVRRCQVVARGFPVMSDRLELRTFCSGTGPRWAERTTTVSGPAGEVQAIAVWACVSRETGRPVAPGEEFLRVFGESAEGNIASARLSLPRPPEGGAAGRPWPLRAADFDTAGHVNNTVTWAAVEDVLAETGWPPVSAEVEYQRAILPGCEPQLVSTPDAAGILMWLVADGHVLATARLNRG